MLGRWSERGRRIDVDGNRALGDGVGQFQLDRWRQAGDNESGLSRLRQCRKVLPSVVTSLELTAVVAVSV